MTEIPSFLRKENQTSEHVSSGFAPAPPIALLPFLMRLAGVIQLIHGCWAVWMIHEQVDLVGWGVVTTAAVGLLPALWWFVGAAAFGLLEKLAEK